MSGRYEKEQIIEQQVLNNLNGMPSILVDYYYSLIGSGKSYGTAQLYINNILRFINFTFNEECEENFYTTVTSNHINKYISSLRTRTTNGKTERTSDSYKTTNWSSLNSFFQFLVPTYIAANPVDHTQRPKMKDNPDVTFLTPEEIIQFFKNVEERAEPKFLNRDLCVFRIGFSTGLRISAIMQIDLDDLDLEHNRIRITEKGDRDEYVMIGENLKAQLMLWLEDRKKYFSGLEHDALFISRQKNRLSDRTVEDLIKQYAIGATDKKVTPHVMRHSCATNLYDATGDIYLCAKQLHHKNVATTQRYAELSREKQKKAANILDNMF